MMGHNITFKGVISKTIPKLSLLPLLIWGTGAIMHLKDAYGMANSVEPDQTDLGLHCLLRPTYPNI